MAHKPKAPPHAPTIAGSAMPSVRVPKTAEVIADQIRQKIVRGELRENDSLPSEALLMAALGISRPTLREAFRILEADRMLTIVRGSRSGARVHRPRADSVSRVGGFVLQSGHTTISDIYQARLAIEPFAARMVAEQNSAAGARILDAEMHPLHDLLARQDYAGFMLTMRAYHLALAACTRNQTIFLMISMLHDLTLGHQTDYVRRGTATRRNQEEILRAGIKSFRRLIELIAAGDGNRAEAHWRLHTINANREWLIGVPPDAPLDCFIL